MVGNEISRDKRILEEEDPKKAAALKEMRQQLSERFLEIHRATVSFATQAVRSAFLLNGGAAIALMTFLGHHVEKKPPAIQGAALACFTLGALCAVVVLAFLYLSQQAYSDGLGVHLSTLLKDEFGQDRKGEWEIGLKFISSGDAHHTRAIWMCVVGAALFVVGVGCACWPFFSV